MTNKLQTAASTEIKRRIRETRKEMNAKGIRRMSCMNGGLSGEAYSLNALMFRLETELESAIKAECIAGAEAPSK